MKICKAVDFAASHHAHEVRKDDSPFIGHPLNVAGMLQDFKLPDDDIVASILHDTCEESSLCPFELDVIFGAEVSMMVYFLSKEEKELFGGDSKKRLQHYISKLRQGALLYPQILIIKMADQLDNFKTLNVFSEEKQNEIVMETRDFYMPMYSKFLKTVPMKYKKAYKKLFKKLKSRLEEM